MENQKEMYEAVKEELFREAAMKVLGDDVLTGKTKRSFLKKTLNQIKDAGYGYIIASRIKALSEAIKQEILNQQGYIRLNEDLRYKEIKKDEGSRLVVFHSRKRQEKDRAERERLIQKAEELIKSPSSITASIKRGGRKYIKPLKNTGFQIDHEAIKQDEAFDGYFGIQSSEEALTATEILNYYHELWKIEESFRCMKSTLEVRPIFHWTERRIKGHFVMCFIAFLLERALEIELKRKGLSISSDRIRQAINTMNYVELEVDERKVYIKTKLTNEAKKILKAVGMKAPANIISEDEVTS